MDTDSTRALPYNSAKLLEAAFPNAPPWSMRRE